VQKASTGKEGPRAELEDGQSLAPPLEDEGYRRLIERCASPLSSLALTLGIATVVPQHAGAAEDRVMSRILRVLAGIIVLGAVLATPRPMETSTVWLLAAGGGLGFRVVIHGIPLSPGLQRGVFYGGAAVLVVALNAFPFLPQWSRYVNFLVLAGLAATMVGAPLKEWWFRGPRLTPRRQAAPPPPGR